MLKRIHNKIMIQSPLFMYALIVTVIVVYLLLFRGSDNISCPYKFAGYFHRLITEM